MRRLILVALLAAAACSSPEPAGNGNAGGGGNAPEPTATPHPWTLTVGKVTYTSKAFVGGDVTTSIVLKNTGKADNPGVKLQFTDIDKYADLEGCIPKCDVSSFFGEYTDLPGVAAGKTVTYRVNFIAKSVGAVHWSVCIYDAPSGEIGDQVWCGDAATTIR